MIYKLFFFFITFSFAAAQTDWVKWEAKQVSYQISGSHLPEISSQSQKSGGIITSFRNVYQFMFSELDGDNCPFHPSCSSFYVEAVNESNFFKGTLMFVDRFTRDINFFKGSDHYLYFSKTKFFDPPTNYLLDENKIQFKYSNQLSK